MTDKKNRSRSRKQPRGQAAHEGFYRAFEDRFRGSRELICSRLKIYLPFIEPLKSIEPRPAAVDLGCGRGEWLELLRDNGFEAQGVDLDKGMLAACVKNRLRVVKGDAILFLHELADESQAIISGFHIGEHLPFAQLQSLVHEAFRVLKPGGLLILETPNPENILVSSLSFYVDPTHRNPLPPELLSFLPEYYGFERVKAIRLQENPEVRQSQSASLALVLGAVSPDYAVVAQKGAEAHILALFDAPFAEQFGVSFDQLVTRFDQRANLNNEQMNKWKARIDEIEKHRERERTAWAALENQLTEQQDVRAALERQVGGQEAEIARLNQHAAEQRERCGTLERQVAAHDTEIVRLHEQITKEREQSTARELQLGLQEAEISRLNHRIAEMDAWGQAALAHEAVLKQHLAELEAQRTAFLASTSWRMTAPLRSFSRLVRRLLRAPRWFARGVWVWGWGTFRPGSRPRRIAKHAAVELARFARVRPAFFRPARQALRRLPTLEKRLKEIVRGDLMLSVPTPLSPGNAVASEPGPVRLAYVRLQAARRQAELEPAPGAEISREKPRLAYFSPLPPARTGIADYSAELLPALSQHYDIDVIVCSDAEKTPLPSGCLAVRDAAWFERHARLYDRIVYHIGNSLFHHHMFPLLEKFPGVVVLHDFYIGHLLEFLETKGGWHKLWTRALYEAHGYDAVLSRFGEASYAGTIRDYPANFFLLRQAMGIITHSVHSQALAHRFYGKAAGRDWAIIPSLRKLTEVTNRPAARATLGLNEEDFLVCCFGFLGETKLNRRLLDAWLGSRLSESKSCHLVFVGEAPNDEYCGAMRRTLSAAGPKGRLHITGFASAEIYKRYLAAADLAVQLRAHSRGESSRTVADCMAHGLPVVVNAHGSMAELSDHCVVKLADAFTDSELIETLERLYADPAAARALGLRAADCAAREWAPEKIAARYRDAIEGFADRAPDLFNHRKLSAIAEALEETRADDSGWVAKARELAEAAPLLSPARQLLVDISALARVDLKTGIQRAVKAQLKGLLDSPPKGSASNPSGSLRKAVAGSYATRAALPRVC